MILKKMLDFDFDDFEEDASKSSFSRSMPNFDDFEEDASFDDFDPEDAGF